MDSGSWLTGVTAWMAFASWMVTLLLGARQSSAGLGNSASLFWLLGACFMLTHTVLAFHFFHGWSHTAAVVETARQTRELTGLNWGGGVWLNYLFLAVWLADAVWRLASQHSHARRPRFLTIATHGFLAFMWFNATVVFGSWPMRVVGVLACGALASRYRRSKRLSPSNASTGSTARS